MCIFLILAISILKFTGYRHGNKTFYIIAQHSITNLRSSIIKNLRKIITYLRTTVLKKQTKCDTTHRLAYKIILSR